MIKILIKFFIKDFNNIEDEKVREKYGVLGGAIGICANIFLFAIKLIIGLVMNSIAIISDAFNNLSDLGSSLVAVIGTKLSNAKPDKEHPFGHGRFEYISSLIVSFIILIMGFELLKSSISKIINPSQINFNFNLLIILFLTALIKLWMYFSYRYMGRKISSVILNAAACDSLNDVIATLAVIFSTVLGSYTALPVDGVLGLIVSLMIMYTGFGISKTTIGMLLGTPPDDETVKKIEDTILEKEGIIGVHDLIVHDYGPGRTMASIHAEVPHDINIVDIHEVIDETEQYILNEFGIHLVIHTDPIITDCPKTEKAKELVNSIIINIDERLSIHDFRMTDGEKNINLIFDLVIPSDIKTEKKNDILKIIKEKLKGYDERYNAVVKIDNYYL